MNWLLVAVETGSLSGAARRLGKPLTTVSRRIADLESYLGVRLLVRSTRRLDLTEAGRSYILACRRILNDVAEAERTAVGEYVAPKGRLTITAPVLFGRLHVLPVIVEFLNAYPEVDVQLVAADRIVHLVEDEVDVAIRIGELADSQLIAICLGEVRRVICASPEYLALRGEPQNPGEVAERDCIRFQNLSGAETWRFSINGREQYVSIRTRLVVNAVETAIDAAMAGLGLVQVLSYQIDAALREQRLCEVLSSFEVAPLPVHLVHAQQGVKPAKLRAFLDFAAPRLREALSKIQNETPR